MILGSLFAKKLIEEGSNTTIKNLNREARFLIIGRVIYLTLPFFIKKLQKCSLT